MKTKEWIIVVIVMIVIAIVVSLLSAQLTGDAILNRVVKANSCDADAICEIQAGTMKTIKVGLSPDGTLPAFYVNTMTSGMDEIQVNNQATFKNNVIVDSGFTAVAVKVTSLVGNGTAYACIDNGGKIVRSSTACR